MNVPKNAHEHDLEWIKDRLALLTPQMRARAVDGYENAFRLVMESDLPEQKKTNAARHEANFRLRMFVDRFYRAAMGHCAPPPQLKS